MKHQTSEGLQIQDLMVAKAPKMWAEFEKMKGSEGRMEVSTGQTA